MLFAALPLGYATNILGSDVIGIVTSLGYATNILGSDVIEIVTSLGYATY